VWHLGIAHGIMGALKESPAEAGKECDDDQRH
jgi:hypothetical protein